MEIIFGLLGLSVLLVILAAFVLLGLFLLRKLGVLKMKKEVNELGEVEQSSQGVLEWSALRESILFRIGIVTVLTLLMAAPLDMVESVVRERSHLYQSVLNDIARTWGQQQKLSGPMLLVPYTEKHIRTETITDKDKNERKVNKVVLKHYTAIVLPEALNIDVALNDEQRKRGIYESLVYQADLNVTGSFKFPRIQGLSNYIDEIHWDKAWLSLGISDTQAIKKASALKWNKQAIHFESGTRVTKLLARGFHAPIALDQTQKQYNFSLNLQLNGSGGFFFEPFGRSTDVTMKASWPHPSFQGSVLPQERNISADGFDASWHIPHLARNYPQLWTLEKQQFNVHEFEAGALLFEPISLYSQITRAIKYGILFIALTYITFLLFELGMKQRLHWVQYGIIGIALSIFYLMLLSLSEHIRFLPAYLISAGTIISMISLYVYAAMKSMKGTLLIALLLMGLYGILYSLLKLEDYALLMGTALLVVILGIMMYFTRNTGK